MARQKPTKKTAGEAARRAKTQENAAPLIRVPEPVAARRVTAILVDLDKHAEPYVDEHGRTRRRISPERLPMLFYAGGLSQSTQGQVTGRESRGFTEDELRAEAMRAGQEMRLAGEATVAGNLGPAAQRRNEGQSGDGRCSHSEDYVSVTWHGRALKPRFTPRQAAIVEQLWEAWENGGHALKEETIKAGLDVAGNTESGGKEKRFSVADTMRVKAAVLGKDGNIKRWQMQPHPAMGFMIHRGGKGIWTLGPPPKNENGSE